MNVGTIVPTVVQPIVMGATLLAALVLVWKAGRSVRDVLIQRLPRPFLGDGSNMQWVIQKRIELSQGVAPLNPGTPTEMTKSDLATLPDAELDWDGTFESKTRFRSRDERELLEAWLAQSRHDQDDWASRILSGNLPGPEEG